MNGFHSALFIPFPQVRNRFGLSDPSPYCVGHRSNFAGDVAGPRSLYLEDGDPFDLNQSRRFPKGFDIYKEPYEGYTHAPRFLLQEDSTQYGVKNSCPEITWNLYGFPMPDVTFAFEGKEVEMGEKYSFNYSRNGVVSLQVSDGTHQSGEKEKPQGFLKQFDVTYCVLYTRTCICIRNQPPFDLLNCG